MDGNYTLKNGKRIRVFLSEDLLKGKICGEKISGCTLDSKGEYEAFEDFECEVKKDNDGLYFIYDKEKIYLSDFEALCIEEINESLEGNKYIQNNDLLNTLMKHKDTIGLVVELPKQGKLCKKFDYILCEPTGDVSDWVYMITLMPVTEEDKMSYSGMQIYIEDLTSEINAGRIKLVDKIDYLRKHSFQKVNK